MDGTKNQPGNAFFVHRQQGQFLFENVHDIKMTGRHQDGWEEELSETHVELTG